MVGADDDNHLIARNRPAHQCRIEHLSFHKTQIGGPGVYCCSDLCAVSDR